MCRRLCILSFLVTSYCPGYRTNLENEAPLLPHPECRSRKRRKTNKRREESEKSDGEEGRRGESNKVRAAPSVMLWEKKSENSSFTLILVQILIALRETLCVSVCLSICSCYDLPFLLLIFFFFAFLACLLTYCHYSTETREEGGRRRFNK